MKKGFTLMELLAVIVVLAIIATVVVPVVLGIINNAETSTKLRSGDLYIDSIQYAIYNSKLDKKDIPDQIYDVMNNGDICIGTLTSNYCDGEVLKVEVTGEPPKSGKVSIFQGEVMYVETLEFNDFYLSSSINGKVIESEKRAICEAVTKDTRLKDKHYAFNSIDTNDYSTVLSNKLTYIGNIPEGNFEPGDEYLCEVKPGTVYRFYVLSEDSETGEVNLIMDSNVTSQGTPVTSSDRGLVKWISEEDYLLSGGAACTSISSSYTECSHNTKGPITAMNFLSQAVSDWTNIPEKQFNQEIKAIGMYGEFKEPFEYGDVAYMFDYKTRARMITIEEALDVGCYLEFNDDAGNKYFFNTCPLWLSNNLQFRDIEREGATRIGEKSQSSGGIRGYWTLSVGGWVESGRQMAYEIYDHININMTYVYRDNYVGVRPVITLSKDNLK